MPTESNSASSNWYRSWPEQVPMGRAYVVDSLPRLVMRDQNYATLADYQPWPRVNPGWFMLEWDIALDRASRERFAANAHPDRVSVAPYLLSNGRQVHRRKGVPIVEGERAEMFGFGCIYFPQATLDEFWTDPPPRVQRELTDTVFSDWYRTRYGNVTVDWSVHPQHLHGD